MNHTLYLFCSMLHAILCLLVHILVSFRMNMTEDQGLGSIQVQIPSLSNSSKALLLLLLLSRFSCVRLCVTPQIAAHQAPPSLGFSRQEHWSGLPFPSPTHESEKWNWSRSVVSDSERLHGLQPTRLLCPWDFPGKSTGVGHYCLLPQSTAGAQKIVVRDGSIVFLFLIRVYERGVGLSKLLPNLLIVTDVQASY